MLNIPGIPVGKAYTNPGFKQSGFKAVLSY